MNELLKARFSKDEIELAGSIGASDSLLAIRIKELFSALHDPLLCADEVLQLLDVAVSKGEIQDTLNELTNAGSLESSASTMRPLDSEDTTLYRRADLPYARLRLQAQEAKLANGSSRFVFTCDGRLIRSIARVDRLDALTGSGNQREEVRRHVERIAKGIENGTEVPNSILLVLLEDQFTTDLDSAPQSSIRVIPLTAWEMTQVPTERGGTAQHVRTVELDFPFRVAAFDEEKVALLVDGQQRTAALSMVDVEKVPHFALSVNAVCADADSAKKIFQVANSTQKIATEFSRALMATMSDVPPHLLKERNLTLAVQELALKDRESPFFERVKYSGIRESKGRPIAYNSLFALVADFEGSTLPWNDDPLLLAEIVKKAYLLVQKTWPDAWDRKPGESRLVHGVGLRGIAALLTHKLEHLSLLPNIEFNSSEMWDALGDSLARLQQTIIWMDSSMPSATKTAQANWRDEISLKQNTAQDIAALGRFLKKESLHLDESANQKSKKKKVD